MNPELEKDSAPGDENHLEPRAGEASPEEGAPPDGDSGRDVVHLRVEMPPGARIRLTVESAEIVGDAESVRGARVSVEGIESGGKQIDISPVKITIEPAYPEPTIANALSHTLNRVLGRTEQRGNTLSGRWKWSLETTLFGIAILLYLGVRLVGLQNFPIYFFTDEAVQTVLAADLVRDGFRNPDDILFPTYFRNGYQYNLSVSVYAQMLPYLLFGKSILVTRGTSVLITVLAAVAMGLILKRVFALDYWWAATLLFSTVPAWFLHSRTAFETAIATSLYAVFIYFYLQYRHKSPQYLYAALIVGALTFYSYSPAQVVVVVTGLLFGLSDFKYHWKNRSTAFKGVGLLILLVLPYIRFFSAYPFTASEHLQNLASYWVRPIPLQEKIQIYIGEYLYGLSPAYWYIPNDRDFFRHQMLDYGNIMLITLPFAVLGLLIALRYIRDARYRILLLSLLAAPTGGALVQTGITRSMIFIIPATLLTAIGLSKFLTWFQGRLAPRKAVGWLAVGTFVILALINVNMTRDALVNGPLWYSDYGLGGMQYGARQIFGEIEDYLQRNPRANLMLSPTWANGTNEIARFFFTDPLPFDLGSIEGHITRRQEISRNDVFVVTPIEYDIVVNSPKFQNVEILQTLPYPNGVAGFYFLKMEYVDDIDEIFAVEAELRRMLEQALIPIDDENVYIEHSRFDTGTITQVFDGDDLTLARTEEANPAEFKLTFLEPKTFSEVSVVLGSIQAKITVRLFPDESGKGEPVIIEENVRGTIEAPEVTLDFGGPVTAQYIELEVFNPYQGEPAHIHIWEIKFK